MGLKAGLDGYGEEKIFCSYRGSNTEPSGLQKLRISVWGRRFLRFHTRPDRPHALSIWGRFPGGKVADGSVEQKRFYLHTYLLTYLLTPCSRFLLEKLTGFQLVKKFPAFFGTRKFITAFTTARHLFLS